MIMIMIMIIKIIIIIEQTKQLKKMRLDIVDRIETATAKAMNAITQHTNLTEDAVNIHNGIEDANKGFQSALDALQTEIEEPSGIFGPVNEMMDDIDEIKTVNSGITIVDRDINSILREIEQITKVCEKTKLCTKIF